MLSRAVEQAERYASLSDCSPVQRYRRSSRRLLVAWSRVYFTAANAAEHVRQGRPQTKLSAFFELCQNDQFAATLLYCDVPSYYTWHESSKTFKRRKQGIAVEGHGGIFKSDVIGRVYTIHPSNAECFYLRMLLHEVPGPKSLDDLKPWTDISVRRIAKRASAEVFWKVTATG